MNRLSKAVNRMADLVDGGHLLAATDSAGFLNAVCDEIERLRAELAKHPAQQAAVEWVSTVPEQESE